MYKHTTFAEVFLTLINIETNYDEEDETASEDFKYSMETIVTLQLAT